MKKNVCLVICMICVLSMTGCIKVAASLQPDNGNSNNGEGGNTIVTTTVSVDNPGTEPATIDSPEPIEELKPAPPIDMRISESDINEPLMVLKKANGDIYPLIGGKEKYYGPFQDDVYGDGIVSNGDIEPPTYEEGDMVLVYRCGDDTPASYYDFKFVEATEEGYGLGIFTKEKGCRINESTATVSIFDTVSGEIVELKSGYDERTIRAEEVSGYQAEETTWIDTDPNKLYKVFVGEELVTTTYSNCRVYNVADEWPTAYRLCGSDYTTELIQVDLSEVKPGTYLVTVGEYMTIMKIK